jgi:hypothetical protein
MAVSAKQDAGCGLIERADAIDMAWSWRRASAASGRNLRICHAGL